MSVLLPLSTLESNATREDLYCENHMLRKLVIWLLLIPLPLNGLWLACRDAPGESPAPAESSAEADANLFESVANAQADSGTGAACLQFCAIKSGGRDGSFCLVSGGSKTSLTILVFGVAILPPEVPLHRLTAARPFIAELPSLYMNPSIDGSTPPPEA